MTVKVTTARFMLLGRYFGYFMVAMEGYDLEEITTQVLKEKRDKELA